MSILSDMEGMGRGWGVRLTGQRNQCQLLLTVKYCYHFEVTLLSIGDFSAFPCRSVNKI